MSSKKYRKSTKPVQEAPAKKSQRSPATVWLVRIVVVLLCVAVAITLIPSVFF